MYTGVERNRVVKKLSKTRVSEVPWFGNGRVQAFQRYEGKKRESAESSDGLKGKRAA